MKLSKLISPADLSAVLMFAAGGEPAAKPVIIESTQQIAYLQVDERDVVSLNVRLRFTTFIVLPQRRADTRFRLWR